MACLERTFARGDHTPPRQKKHPQVHEFERKNAFSSTKTTRKRSSSGSYTAPMRHLSGASCAMYPPEIGGKQHGCDTLTAQKRCLNGTQAPQSGTIAARMLQLLTVLWSQAARGSGHRSPHGRYSACFCREIWTVRLCPLSMLQYIRIIAEIRRHGLHSGHFGGVVCAAIHPFFGGDTSKIWRSNAHL